MLDDLPTKYAVSAVRDVVLEVVAAEGPVHVERLARHVAACFDLARVSRARSQAIVSTLPRELTVESADPFVWPDGSHPSGWTSFRTSSSDERPLEHVALREIGNAMVALCHTAAGVSADELDTAALALFGGKRRTAGIAGRLTQARELAIRQGRLSVAVNGLHKVS